MQEQLNAAGLLPLIERVGAVDAQAPGFSAPGYMPHRWGDRWELKRSEQAVFESHRSVWKIIAEGADASGIVCEDDIYVSGTFKYLLSELDCAKFGVVKLDGFNASRRYGSEQSMGGWPVWEICEAVPSAACYAVSRSAAQQLMDDSENYCATLDDFVFKKRAGIWPVQIVPAVAVQRMCCSTDSSQSEREASDSSHVSKGPAIYRLRKEVGRALGRFRKRRASPSRVQLARDLPPYKA